MAANIQIELSEKLLLLENFMRRMRERKQHGFVLDGVITQSERNALHTAIESLKRHLHEHLLENEPAMENDNMSASID